MRHALLSSLLSFGLLATPTALADGSQAALDCAVQACTCAAGPTGQCPRHRPGKSRTERSAAKLTFDTKTVTSVTGTVVEVQRVDHGGVAQGVLLTLQAGDERLTVHVGPSFYVDPKMSFAVQDVVEVKGSRLDVAGAPTLLAMTVAKNGKSVSLRSAEGTPLFRRGPGARRQ